MPGSDERQPALLTIAIKRDDGENIEIKQQPIDIFAEHPAFAAPFYKPSANSPSRQVTSNIC